jgi:hypothetical protein
MLKYSVARHTADSHSSIDYKVREICLDLVQFCFEASVVDRGVGETEEMFLENGINKALIFLYDKLFPSTSIAVERGQSSPQDAEDCQLSWHQDHRHRAYCPRHTPG